MLYFNLFHNIHNYCFHLQKYNDYCIAACLIGSKKSPFWLKKKTETSDCLGFILSCRAGAM